MRTLLLIRHAKSSWAEPGLADHDRPLNDRGRRDAPAMGARLRDEGLVPGVIRSSTALRARTTAGLLADALGLAADAVVLDRGLYGADPETLLDAAAELPGSAAIAALVAHDPGLSELAYRLSDGAVDHMPTCAVLVARFEVDGWRDLRRADPVAVRLLTPRDPD